MFRSESFVQFVFADVQDIYCLNSGMQLPLDAFLWFQLHKAGYTSIYFVSKTQNGCMVSVKDEASFQCFENRTRGGFLKNLFGDKKRTYTRENKKTVLQGTAYHSFVKWMPECLEQEQQAFVIQADAFDTMLQDKAVMQHLNEIQTEHLTHGKLLITAAHDSEQIHTLQQQFGTDTAYLNRYSEEMVTAVLHCAQNQGVSISKERFAKIIQRIDREHISYRTLLEQLREGEIR